MGTSQMFFSKCLIFCLIFLSLWGQLVFTKIRYKYVHLFSICGRILHCQQFVSVKGEADTRQSSRQDDFWFISVYFF